MRPSATPGWPTSICKPLSAVRWSVFLPSLTLRALAPPLAPTTGRPYNPVVTLNCWTCPWRMRNGVKEFHLVAEPVVREIAPGIKATVWGYNGQSPEHTTIHWHGQRLPNGMDGVGGLNQPQIPVGKTFVYEFEARRPGTFMYHPHADEMTQMAMGMMGFWVTHPKPKTMLDFNLWTWNSRAFPGIDTLNVRLGDKVRIRVGNLTMNAMGHSVPNMIGMDHRGLLNKIQRVAPGYMAMGERNMADMGEMAMPLPDNTLPMMAGIGPDGPIEMGGMFTTLKVRRNQKRGDYSDPGWYKQPPGTQSYAWTGALPTTGSDLPPAARARSAPATGSPSNTTELWVKKPGAGHHNH